MQVGILLDELLENNHGFVHIRDIAVVKTKLERMVLGGCGKLMTVSDFDSTLSKPPASSLSAGMFQRQLNKKAAQEFYAEMSKNWGKYKAIEDDTKMTREQKLSHLDELNRMRLGVIVRYGFQKQKMAEMVAQSKISLRDGAKELLKALERLSVPLVVFSAGIGNVIELALKQQVGCIPKNTHVIANFMRFNPNGVCVAFSEPLIHTLNKNSSVVRKDVEFFHQLNDRSSVLLIGDSLGDVHMDVGLENIESVVLKIGYLNHHSTCLEQYMKEYDIVLVGKSQSMRVPCEILRWIETGTGVSEGA